MKIISQAVLRGFVERDLPDLGAIEISGLLIYLDKGAAVQANDFVQLDMTQDEHGLWRARIDVHLNNPLSAAAQAPITSVGSAVQTSAHVRAPVAPAQQPAAHPTTVRSFTRHSQPISAPAATAGAPTPAAAPAAPAPAAATSATAASRASRFGARAQSQRPAARAPAPAPPPGLSRPAFMDSADFNDDEIPF